MPVVIQRKPAGLVPDVNVHWSYLREGDPRRNSRRCLYAVLHPRTEKVLNVGLAYYTNGLSF